LLEKEEKKWAMLTGLEENTERLRSHSKDWERFQRASEMTCAVLLKATQRETA
jgi:hypothetical protein